MIEVDEHGRKWEMKSVPNLSLKDSLKRLSDRAEEEIQLRIAQAVAEFKGKVLALIDQTAYGYGAQLLMDKVEALK